MDLTGIGATGIFIIYLLKTVLPFIIPSYRGNNNKEISQKLEIISCNLGEVSRNMQDLHSWCSETDSDGVKLMYVRRSLFDAMERTADGIKQVAVVLDKMNDNHNNLFTRLEKNVESIRDGVRLNS